jgi:hypothetical protein
MELQRLRQLQQRTPVLPVELGQVPLLLVLPVELGQVPLLLV